MEKGKWEMEKKVKWKMGNGKCVEQFRPSFLGVNLKALDVLGGEM